ncbi:lysophospholipid acyltransferase family protein [Verrucomicrobiota bacterium]
MKYRFKHIAEYAVLRSIAALVRVLPYRAALFVGWLNAWLFFHVFHFRVKKAVSRINEVFGDRFTRREMKNIAWLSWRNIVFSGIEMIRLDKITLNWINSISDYQHFMDVLTKHSKTGKGGIIAVPHMGSWELAAVGCHLYKIPIFTIAARQKNPLTNRYMNELRRSPGIDTLARGSGTMKEVLRKLRKGGMLAILPDVRMRTEGLSVPFLGAKANVGKGMASFAKHTGTPIFPCIITRIGWARHKMEIHDPIWPDENLNKKDDINRMTHSVLKIFDETIQKDPDQWFWYNSRWILDPLKEKSGASSQNSE